MENLLHPLRKRADKQSAFNFQRSALGTGKGEMDPGCPRASRINALRDDIGELGVGNEIAASLRSSQ